MMKGGRRGEKSKLRRHTEGKCVNYERGIGEEKKRRDYIFLLPFCFLEFLFNLFLLSYLYSFIRSLFILFSFSLSTLYPYLSLLILQFLFLFITLTLFPSLSLSSNSPLHLLLPSAYSIPPSLFFSFPPSITFCFSSSFFTSSLTLYTSPLSPFLLLFIPSSSRHLSLRQFFPLSFFSLSTFFSLLLVALVENVFVISFFLFFLE